MQFHNKIKLFLILFATSAYSLHAQTIDSIKVAGGTPGGSGTSWSVEFFSSTDNTVNDAQIIPITLYMDNTKGEYIVFDQSGSSSDWEVNQSSNPGSNSWKSLCHDMLENNSNCNGAPCSSTYYLRHVGTTAGDQTNTITIAISNKQQGGSRCYYDASKAITLNITAKKVTSKGIYTWSEPQSGTDSSYKVSTNWTPERTSPKTDDILVVNLAQGTERNTTIDISNVSETIGQFKIYPYNNVTFKCTANTSWTVGPNSGSLTGDDWVAEASSVIRKSGTGTLDINIKSGNTLDINGPIYNTDGTLLFSGDGTHRISGNIYTAADTLSFNPSSGTTNTLYLDGSDQSISNSSGTLYIDSAMDVTVGTGTACSLTLNRTLPLYSTIKLLENCTLVSNNPASSSESDWHAWTPYLQLKAWPYLEATKRGQLGEVPSTAVLSGGALFEIYGTNVRSYRAIGSPLQGLLHLSQFADDIDLTGTVTGNNKDSFTTTCSVCKSSVYYWDESSGSFKPYASGNTANKVAPGQGVLVFFRGAKSNGLGDTSAAANNGIIDFKGYLRTGDFTYNLNYNSGSGFSGYNLVANPYPANISFESIFDNHKAKVKARLRLYDARSKTYNVWDSTISTSPGKSGANKFKTASDREAKIIAPGASFFIEVKNQKQESITFTEAMKNTTLSPKTKHHGVQELNETPCNEFSADLHYVSDTAFESDNFTLLFDIEHPEVTNDGEDADVDKFWAGYMGIGSMTANGKWCAIDRRAKLAEVGQTHTIDLQTYYPKEGPNLVEMTFNYCTVGNGNYKVQLVDKLLNKVIEASDKENYQFNINTAEEKDKNRFQLIFTGIEQSNSIDEIVKHNFIVYPNPVSTGEINIIANNQNIFGIEVLNNLGQSIRKVNFSNNNNSQQVNINELGIDSGIYYIKIFGQRSTETHRIVTK